MNVRRLTWSSSWLCCLLYSNWNSSPTNLGGGNQYSVSELSDFPCLESRLRDLSRCLCDLEDILQPLKDENLYKVYMHVERKTLKLKTLQMWSCSTHVIYTNIQNTAEFYNTIQPWYIQYLQYSYKQLIYSINSGYIQNTAEIYNTTLSYSIFTIQLYAAHLFNKQRMYTKHSWSKQRLNLQEWCQKLTL